MVKIVALSLLLAAQAVWMPVGTWSGDGSKDTETFTTTQKEWRLTWTTKAFLGITVKSAETNKTVANASGTENGETYVRVPPGKYYLSLIASTKWSVTAEEQR